MRPDSGGDAMAGVGDCDRFGVWHAFYALPGRLRVFVTEVINDIADDRLNALY